MQVLESTRLIKQRNGALTLWGYGISICVERGHLIVKDGNGISRLSRVRHGLRRLVVIGSDGFITLAALEWLSSQNASFILLERDGSILSVVGPVSPSDARLRRAQALAGQTGADIRIARELIRSKLVGQEGVAREKLHNPIVAESIARNWEALDNANTIPAIRQLEARAGFSYWSAWKAVPVLFPKADARKIPDHWKVFGSRISPISHSPRLAVNPANAILNYLYAVLESESRLALAAVGLDPGLGFLHVDSRTRDSGACDLMEPVRPEVDAYVFDWIMRQPLNRKWFFEMADGSCRLMGSFCVQLSQTARTWGHAVAPWAELVARTLWSTVPKQGNRPGPATPLTGNHRRAGRVGEHVRPVVSPPKPLRICKTCGVECEKTYCASCGAAHSLKEFDKGRLVAQSPESRERRSRTQRTHVRAIRVWKPSQEFAWLDRKTYISRIQPRLAGVTVSTLQSALGISEPYAAFIRAGSRVPHPRHWPTLARLVGVASAAANGVGSLQRRNS